MKDDNSRDLEPTSSLITDDSITNQVKQVKCSSDMDSKRKFINRNLRGQIKIKPLDHLIDMMSEIYEKLYRSC